IYDTTPLTGRLATKAVFLKIAKNYEMIHVVAHAETNTTSPLFYRIRLHATRNDIGALEIRDIFRLNLDRLNLIVLAACGTDLGEGNSRDDIVTLGRAFMSAGAS